MLSIVSEVLSDGASCVRSQELEGSSIRSGGGHNDGVFQGAVISQNLHDVGNGGPLLADSNVNAVESVRVASVGVIELGLLVKNGINSNGGFASLSVTDDQLSLASANRDLLNSEKINDIQGSQLISNRFAWAHSRTVWG